MATLKDIADKLGVNKSTVSRALSDSKRISPAMRRKVQRAAASIGYQINPMARNLATGTTKWGILIGRWYSVFWTSGLVPLHLQKRCLFPDVITGLLLIRSASFCCGSWTTADTPNVKAT